MKISQSRSVKCLLANRITVLRSPRSHMRKLLSRELRPKRCRSKTSHLIQLVKRLRFQIHTRMKSETGPRSRSTRNSLLENQALEFTLVCRRRTAVRAICLRTPCRRQERPNGTIIEDPSRPPPLRSTCRTLTCFMK